MRPNPRSAEYPEGSEARRRLDQFNRSYSAVLHLLDEAFNGSPALLAVATGQMYGLKQEAIALMELPTGDRKTTVGPSFEYVAPGLRHRRAAGEQRIVVVADGPYLVYGEVPLARKRRVVSENGKALTWEKREVLETEETYALCRCGRSETKPFCDGTHAELGFDGTETAESGATAERQRILGGTGIIVRRDHSLCMHAGFCEGRTRGIAEMIDDTDDSDVRSQVVAMIERCPSGSYVYGLEDSGDEIEPDLPVGIAVVEDPDSLASCLWVTGGIPIERADGEPLETRNRLTLCRCGQSGIKPLCDGTHKEIGFRE
jgi:CDGSH-type Zn-finger protein